MVLALIASIFSSLCWAHNSIVYTLAGERVGSKTVANIRLWFAIPFSIIVNFIFIRKFIPLPQINFNFYLFSFISGFLGFFLADVFIFEAFVKLGPKNTLIILTTTPVFNIIFGFVFFNDIFTLKQIFGSILVILGIVGVIYYDSGNDYKTTENSNTKYKEENNNKIKNISNNKYIYGIILAILGSLLQAFGSVFAKLSFSKSINPVETNFYRLIGGFLGINLYSLIKKELKNDFIKMRDFKSLFYIAFGALVGPVLGVSAALYSIKKISIGLTSVLTNLSPAFVVPMEYFFLKRKVRKIVLPFILISILGTVVIFI